MMFNYVLNNLIWEFATSLVMCASEIRKLVSLSYNSVTFFSPSYCMHFQQRH